MDQELAWIQDIYAYLVTFFIEKGLQLFAAIIITLIGMIIARKAAKYIEGLMLRHELDVTLAQFSAAAIRILITATVIFVALEKIDVKITPLVAAIGAMSLGAGLALQGTLSNYGAGIAIILSRPFIVGDTITVQGVTGIVSQVKLGATVLTNEDDVMITIPNKHIMGEIIHNSSTESIVESSIDIAYDSDTEKAIALIAAACASVNGVNTERPPQVGIDTFADSGITIAYRLWVPTDQLFELRYKVNSAVFSALKQHDVQIPFPQREVRMLTEQRAG